MPTENEIKRLIRVRLSRIAVLWEQPVGTGKTATGSIVSFGLCRGSADLIGIDRGSGRFVAIEVKSTAGLDRHQQSLGRARERHASNEPLSTEERHAFEQEMFLNLVRRSGGIALVAHDPEIVVEQYRKEAAYGKQ